MRVKIEELKKTAAGTTKFYFHCDSAYRLPTSDMGAVSCRFIVFSNDVMIDDSYQIYGVNPITNAPRAMPRPPYDGRYTKQK